MFPIDSLFIYSWVLVSFTLIMHVIYPMPLLFFLTNFVSFLVLMIHVFVIQNVSDGLQELYVSNLVLVHLSMAIAAYAAFSLSSIGTLLYLVHTNLLKKKKWTRFTMQMPSLDRLFSFSNWLVIAGVLLMTIAIVLGSLYAYQFVGAGFWRDLKIWTSLFVLLAYGSVLVQWTASSWQRRRIAWWNTLSFLTILLNYFLSQSSLSFHNWM
nr:cytochrome c biogenesis protein CcsA [Polycladospora coralii]